MNARLILLLLIISAGCRPGFSPPPAEVRLIGASELAYALVSTYNRAIPGVTFSSMLHRPGSIGAVDAVESGLGEAALTGSGVAYTAFTAGTAEVPYPHKSLTGMAVLSVFDGQNALQKDTVDTMVLTDTARQGIFRFLPGVNNGNADATPSGTGTNNAIAAVVDALGNPRDWTQIPGATGPMQSFSVFGDAGFSKTTGPMRRDCRRFQTAGVARSCGNPWVANAQLTSTLSSNIVNEARFGYRARGIGRFRGITTGNMEKKRGIS